MCLIAVLGIVIVGGYIFVTINNLSADDTNDLFHTLDAVLKLGSAENLNLTIGNTVANVLIYIRLKQLARQLDSNLNNLSLI